MIKNKNKVKIFTDGACRGNPGPGGWGALLKYGDVEKKLMVIQIKQQIILWN